MKQTVLITGTTSGIGKAAAEKFLLEGWNVVATARDLKKIQLQGDNLLKLDLDVTNTVSINKAIAKTLDKFGSIDLLVNNAGYGLVGILEELSQEEIQQQFDTNVFGVTRCIQAVLPGMRSKAAGTIITISSMGGRVTFPLYSAYHASKWAVEGMIESSQYELAAVGITSKLVEPGAIKTDFYTRSMDLQKTKLPEYRVFQQKVLPWMTDPGSNASEPSVVADVIYRAATDGSKKLRYTAGFDAWLYTTLKKFLPHWAYRLMIKVAMGI
jgi:NAD(P)-dependent dehydrogenase (short-subunit alcohol dehydrogenase family)